MQTPNQFIIVRDKPGCTYHATLRSAVKPWTVIATCTNTSGPLFAAEAVLRKAGHRGYRAEMVSGHDRDEVTNGYLNARKTITTHVYRIVRS